MLHLHAFHTFDRPHFSLDGLLTRLLEREREVDLVAGLQLLLQTDEHDVISTWLQFYGAASRNFQALAGDGTHLHHLVFHDHFMDLDGVAHGSCCFDQGVRLVAAVLEHHIGSAGSLSGRRRSHPDVFDGDTWSLGAAAARGQQSDGHAHRQKQSNTGDRF